MNKMIEAQKANETKNIFMSYTSDMRNKALEKMANMLLEKKDDIIKENEKDIKAATESNLSKALIDRLLLTSDRIDALSKAVLEVKNQPEVVGAISDTFTREDGLQISRQSIPIGVIAMIFESRPNVVVDCSALAIKSGNCIILKGGKEAAHSNNILASIIRDSIKEYIPEDVVQIIKTREDVSNLLDQVGLVDVIIPRGGEGLIKFVSENSKVPVLAHYKGLCHIFIDESADSQMAIDIAVNAKASRPGVCNAMETLLVHENFKNLEGIINAFKEKNTELRVDSKIKESFSDLTLATKDDWSEEYLDNILSIKLVSCTKEAITHIQEYGSHHTESIVSKSDENIKMFTEQVDASSIMINASTRFNDGGEFGLGAELGISTSKLHAYGPMGAEQMTTKRFLVTGNGHIR